MNLQLSVKYKNIAVLAWVLSSMVSHGLTTLQLGPSSGAAETTILVPLKLVTGDGVTAIQFDLLYDPAVVDLEMVLPGISESSHILDFEIIAAGQARVVVISNTNQVINNGLLSEIRLRLISQVPENTRSISFSNIILSDVTGTEVSISWAPYVAITAPFEGKRFSESSNVGLSAVAIDYDGAITSVEFQVDGQSLSVDSTAPFSASWTATGSGEIILTAIAISSDGGETTSDPLKIRIAPPPYDAWFTANFTVPEQSDSNISGITADPDGDTIPNLLEYALHLDPRVADVDGLPVVGVTTVGPDDFATITYRLNLEADDIGISVEVSANGTDWFAGEQYTEIMNTVAFDQHSEITVRDLQPTISGRLIRLTVHMLTD